MCCRTSPAAHSSQNPLSQSVMHVVGGVHKLVTSVKTYSAIPAVHLSHFQSTPSEVAAERCGHQVLSRYQPAEGYTRPPIPKLNFRESLSSFPFGVSQVAYRAAFHFLSRVDFEFTLPNKRIPEIAFDLIPGPFGGSARVAPYLALSLRAQVYNHKAPRLP